MARVRLLTVLLLLALAFLPVAGAQLPEERIRGHITEATVYKYPDNSSQLLIKMELDPGLDGVIEVFAALTNTSARIYLNADYTPREKIDGRMSFEASLEGEESGAVKGWIRSSVEDSGGRASIELDKVYYKYYRQNSTAYVELEGRIEASGNYSDLLETAGNLSNITGVRMVEAKVTKAPGMVKFKYRMYVTASLDIGLAALAYSKLLGPASGLVALPEGLSLDKASISLEAAQSKVRAELDVRLRGNISVLLRGDSIGALLGSPLLQAPLEVAVEVSPALGSIIGGLRTAAASGIVEVVVPTYYGARFQDGSGEVILPRILYTENPAGTPQALADTARENIRAVEGRTLNVTVVEGQLDEPPVSLPGPVRGEYMGEVSATGYLLGLLALTIIVLAVSGLLVWLGKRM